MAISKNDDVKALELFELSLEQPKDLRAKWISESTESKTIKDKALKYLERDASVDKAFHTGGAIHETLDDSIVPDQIGAYKITGLIGRGGMGAVYRGERISDDFEHNVAIKIIRPRAMSDSLIERFQNERQTLAKLTHANIARLYDGGTLDSGSPYIIMEYVDGKPITEWAEENALSKTDKLNLFLRVCRAVNYAHQNLIIHRDITPSNVLVNNEGNVKLIDFGIAKPFDEDSLASNSTNSLDSLSFTPGFAAPERSKGAGANTLSDIYSLGKLLDALVKSNNTDELKSIINKATESDPDNRYETVGALQDDLQNYLKGHPVSSFKGASGYKFKKFIRRHKFGTALTTVAVIALISALGVTAFQYQRAESARIEADKRFNDVRKLATAMMTDIHQEIYRVPGSTEATKKLVEVAQTYLDELAKDKRAPNAVKREAAIGYTKLGIITGASKGGNFSDLGASDRYFEAAKNLFTDLNKIEPNNVETLTEFGKLFYYMSEVSITPRSKFDLAQSQLDTSISLLQQAVKIDPENIAPALSLLYSECYVAELLINDGKTSEAQTVLRNCIAKGSELLKRDPNNESILRLKSANGRTLANALSMETKFEDAIIVLNQAIDDLNTLAPLLDADNDTFMLRALTIAYWRRGYAHTNTKLNELAISDYNKALEYTNKRLEKNSKDKDANWFYHTIIAEQATPFQAIGQTKNAEAALLKALDWYEARHRDLPENTSRMGNLFVHHFMMGDFYEKAKDEIKECNSYKSAYDYYNLIDKAGAITNYESQNLVELKKVASKCNIQFKH